MYVYYLIYIHIHVYICIIYCTDIHIYIYTYTLHIVPYTSNIPQHDSAIHLDLHVMVLEPRGEGRTALGTYPGSPWRLSISFAGPVWRSPHCQRRRGLVPNLCKGMAVGARASLRPNHYQYHYGVYLRYLTV